ncbi:Nif3-like dinuclear metal center hexameric protein [Acidihalobacter prosperus]
MAELRDICGYADSYLDISRFRDYTPNGLQVEGRSEVSKLVSGVTASQALIEAAIDQNADAILVHHGYFWKGESSRILGPKRQRLKLLLQHDISLIAYHLPLDAHPDVGNNVQLARQLGFVIKGPLNAQGIGLIGLTEEPMTLDDLARRISGSLDRVPLTIPGGATDEIEQIAWCTGAAQGYLEQAAEQGAQVYISGEISEQTVHAARELGVNYIAAGHHATERYGVQSLGAHLARQMGIDHVFIDIDNPA